MHFCVFHSHSASFHFGLSSSNLAVVALAYNGKVLQLQHLFLQLVLNNFMHLSDSNCPAHGATQLLFLNIIAHRWRLQGSIYIFLCWLSTTGNGSEKNSRVLSRTLWAEGLTLVKALVIYRFPVQGNAEFLETPTLTLLERGMFAGCGKIEAKVEGIKWLFWPPGRLCA